MKPTLFLVALSLWTAPSAFAQTPTLVPHAADGRWWLSGQVNVIYQRHGRFNRSTSGGADVAGTPWSRPHDKVGLAVIVNELSPDHQAYLARGGSGFLLGDGKLTYGSERIVETYYTAQVARGIFGSFDLQWINNPGYNQDRGPVVVPGARLHLES